MATASKSSTKSTPSKSSTPTKSSGSSLTSTKSVGTAQFGGGVYNVNSAGVPFGAPLSPGTKATTTSSWSTVGGGSPTYDSVGGFTSGGVYYGPDSIQAKNSRLIQDPNYKPTSNIAVTDLQNGLNAPKIPTTPFDNTDYNSILQGIQSGNLTGGDAIKTITDNSQSKQGDLLKSLIESIGTPPNTADLYKQAQQETDILNKRQKVNDLTGQLNTITANAQANQLAVTGQGRGIPEAIIGGQQAQIAKEAAIAALPVSAQLNAAQGNLQMAEQNLNTLFQIKSADAQAQYLYKKELVKTVYDFASKQEQNKLDLALKLEERAYQETKDLFTLQSQYAKMAFENNQGKLGSQISSLDYKSPTFKSDLAKLQSKIYDPAKALDLQIKAKQLEQFKAPTIKTINGVDMQWDGENKIWIPAITTTPTNNQETTDKSLNQLNFLKDTADKADKLSSGAGRSWLHEVVGKAVSGVTEKQRLEGLSNTLKTNVLTLATDPTIKKFFGPQMSNADVMLMSSAGTTLNPDLQTPQEYKDEISRLQNLFDRMIKSVKSGTTQAKVDEYIKSSVAPALQINGIYGDYSLGAKKSK